MIGAVHRALAAVCARVVLVGRSSHLPALAQVEDLRPDRGPLGGIEALLASGLDRSYLVVPCDLPLLAPPLLRRLLDGGDDGDAVAFRDHPLPALLPAAAHAEVRRLLDEGGGAVHRLLDRLDARRPELPAELAPQLRNVNTPEELATLTGGRAGTPEVRG